MAFARARAEMRAAKEAEYAASGGASGRRPRSGPGVTAGRRNGASFGPKALGAGASGDEDRGAEAEPRVVVFKTGFRNTIYHVMRERPNWRATDAELDWDIHWADRPWMFEVFDYVHLDHHQHVNHYRNDRELCRKDLLIKNVKRYRQVLRKAGKVEEAQGYDFCPQTYLLPMEFAIFEEEFKRTGGAWIMKPIGRSQGKGIFIISKLKEISAWKKAQRWKPSGEIERRDVESYVVQRYLQHPYVVGGKKFDLRVYALVTSFQPLRVWVYRAGFARFSSSRYSVDSLDDLEKHLTNIALQKQSEGYDAETGSKWDLRRLKMYLMSRHGPREADRMFHEMQLIIIRSLLCVQKTMINDKHCFELYGYDVMYDVDRKPWLIEVNASPSLTANTPEDYQLKYRMLSEMLDVVDVEGRRTGEEQHVGGFDLVYDGGPVRCNKGSHFHTFLGAELPTPMIRSLPLSMRGAGAEAARERELLARGSVATAPSLQPPPMSPSTPTESSPRDADFDDTPTPAAGRAGDDTASATTSGASEDARPRRWRRGSGGKAAASGSSDSGSSDDDDDDDDDDDEDDDSSSSSDDGDDEALGRASGASSDVGAQEPGAGHARARGRRRAEGRRALSWGLERGTSEGGAASWDRSPGPGGAWGSRGDEPDYLGEFGEGFDEEDAALAAGSPTSAGHVQDVMGMIRPVKGPRHRRRGRGAPEPRVGAHTAQFFRAVPKAVGSEGEGESDTPTTEGKASRPGKRGRHRGQRATASRRRRGMPPLGR